LRYTALHPWWAEEGLCVVVVGVVGAVEVFRLISTKALLVDFFVGPLGEEKALPESWKEIFEAEEGGLNCGCCCREEKADNGTGRDMIGKDG